MAGADLKNLDHLRIPLEEIISATNNFSQHNIIGHGGFGCVYKGQLPGERGTTVAVKKLGVESKQGDREFLTEIATLASCKHKNLVSLVGFCDQGREKMVVYKMEDNGSLDKHLDSKDLKWEQRLRICLGAAHGLEYLHSGVGAGHRVLHRDLKSSNILLDADWEAKVSDFGLSKIAPRNIVHTFLVTAPCGTLGYVDPKYVSTGVLTKESDVYSFGVVLFEVLCGRVATIMKSNDEFEFLSKLVETYYGDGRLGEIIFPGLVEQMKSDSLELFSRIAFRCLNEDRNLRPKMRTIVEELESALEHQLELPRSQRADAVSNVVNEANARLNIINEANARHRDPVHGCAGAICQHQKQVSELQTELAKAKAEVLNMQCEQSNLLSIIIMKMC